jgi:hypothetical protein
MKKKHTIHRINLLPVAKFGCILGGLAMILPGIICSGLSISAISTLRVLLDGWRSSETEMLGFQVVQFDFVNLLGLSTIQQIIIQLDDQYLSFGVFIFLATVLGGGGLLGITILMLGWVYNGIATVTGGIEVELA